MAVYSSPNSFGEDHLDYFGKWGHNREFHTIYRRTPVIIITIVNQNHFDQISILVQSNFIQNLQEYYILSLYRTNYSEFEYLLAGTFLIS